MDDRGVGRAFRAIRIQHRWRQRDVAQQARVSQRTITEIELGRLEHVSLATLRRVGAVLDVRVQIDAWWRSGRVDHLLDRAHAALVEQVVRRLTAHDWTIRVEFGFNEYGERGSVDVLAWHAATATLLIIEVKTRIDDLQAALASFERKLRLIPRVAARDLDWEPVLTVPVLVMLDTRQNRGLVASHRATIDAIWPGRTVAVDRIVRHRAASDTVAGAPASGGIWFVPPTQLGTGATQPSRVRTGRR
jgi:transcriptional regulator with XRE-family HTH domain